MSSSGAAAIEERAVQFGLTSREDSGSSQEAKKVLNLQSFYDHFFWILMNDHMLTKSTELDAFMLSILKYACDQSPE